MARKDTIVNFVILLVCKLLIVAGVVLWLLNPEWIYLEIGLIVMGVMALVGGIIFVFLSSESKTTET